MTKVKIQKPKQIITTALTSLNSEMAKAENALKAKSPVESGLQLAAKFSSIAKECNNVLEKFKNSVKAHHLAHKTVDGLNVLEDDNLQQKEYQLRQLGARASILANEAEFGAQEEQAKQKEAQVTQQQEKQTAGDAPPVIFVPYAQRKQEQAAEAKKQQAQQATINNAANNILKKVDAVLWDLMTKKADIGNYLPEARQLADDLYATLTEARDEYEFKLKNSATTEEFKEAGEFFKDICAATVESAMPVLEKDLSWGNYLTNMLKAIANAVIYVTTFCQKSNFFAYTKPSADAVTNVNEQLQDVDVSAPSL